jgi:hypothetical protein
MRNVLTIVIGALFLPEPGSQLRPAMELVYHAEGGRQPAWVVDSIHADGKGPSGADCVAVWMRRGTAAEAPADRYCVAGDTLYRWNERGARWEISRPVGPAMRWQTVRANGDSVRYETDGKGQELISGVSVDIIQTTVTTIDAAGRPKARLRERYALSLLTATGGVFEAPDSTRPGEWVRQRSFELHEIRAPAK